MPLLHRPFFFPDIATKNTSKATQYTNLRVHKKRFFAAIFKYIRCTFRDQGHLFSTLCAISTKRYPWIKTSLSKFWFFYQNIFYLRLINNGKCWFNSPWVLVSFYWKSKHFCSNYSGTQGKGFSSLVKMQSKCFTRFFS